MILPFTLILLSGSVYSNQPQPIVQPFTCKANEHLDQCPSTCPPQTCVSIVSLYNCELPQPPCKTGCVCNNGLLRNKAGECVDDDFCLKELACGENQQYSLCANSCPPKTCLASIGFYNCQDWPQCQPGCVCSDGFVKDLNGNCVRPNECFGGCNGDPNAKRGCGVNCNRHCSDLYNPQAICSRICNAGGCDCNDGYYLNTETNRCVLPRDCPKPAQIAPACPANEEYKQCPNACYSDSCVTYGRPNICQAGQQASVNQVWRCTCKPGFRRNANGACVPLTDCYKCKDPEVEFFSCGSACDRTCKTLGQPCPIINIKCNEMCYCKDGFARDGNNNCVPISQCTTNGKWCKGDPNAVSGCGHNCGKRCSDLVQPHKCPLFCLEGGCDCKDGYYLNTLTNRCILRQDCPYNPPTSRCKVNEHLENCPRTCPPQNCLSLVVKYNCLYPQPPTDCKPECVCNNGLLRNKAGDCVDVNFCKKELSCGLDQQYSLCANKCPPNTCSAMVSRIDCTRAPPCQPGCVCQNGLVMNSNGQCVTPDTCFQTTTSVIPPCKTNEEFVNCPITCPSEACEAVGRQYFKCPPPQLTNCIGRCMCKSGYKRNSNGDCVPESYCTKCVNRDVEVFDCGSFCDTTCATLGQTCPIVNIQCNEKCYCKNGYARDANNVCVPISQCKAAGTAGCSGDLNAVSGCGNNCGRKCSDIGKENQLCTLACKVDGCDCKEGYYLNDNGKCVLKNQCTSCGGDPNAVPGCGINCGRSCRALLAGTSNQDVCITVCYDGCDCKPGYYFCENSRRCVLSYQCRQNY